MIATDPTLKERKTALVTGANGYIGNVLCHCLQDHDWYVRALIRKPLDGPWDSACCVDLAEDDLSNDVFNGIDIVFHLAASAHNEISGIDPIDRMVNIEGTRKLLNGAQRGGAHKFVFISTVKVMGEGGSKCMDETTPVEPTSSYGRSKLEAERLVLNQKSVPACVLRLPIVYGNNSTGNLPKMIRAIRNGRFLPLPETYNKRSMVHVLDVVDAAILAAEKDCSQDQTYLVTDGQAYSTRQIYDWICNASGMDLPKWHIPFFALRMGAWLGDFLGGVTKRRLPMNSDILQKLTGSAWYSNAKICTELGFRPRHTLAEALPEMIATVSKADSINL